MILFNLISGGPRTGKSTFVKRAAISSDIIFDDFDINLINNADIWNNYYNACCDRDIQFWILLDPIRVSLHQYKRLFNFFERYGQVNIIKMGPIKMDRLLR